MLRLIKLIRTYILKIIWLTFFYRSIKIVRLYFSDVPDDMAIADSRIFDKNKFESFLHFIKHLMMNWCNNKENIGKNFLKRKCCWETYVFYHEIIITVFSLSAQLSDQTCKKGNTQFYFNGNGAVLEHGVINN